MIKWRIYYDDFSTFDSTMGQPWESPGRGVVCIVQVDPNHPNYNVNTQILRGHPYYWFDIEWGYWMHSDRDGVLDQFISDRKDVKKALKQGRWASYADYHAIVDLAKKDPDFLEKSGSSLAETRYVE